MDFCQHPSVRRTTLMYQLDTVSDPQNPLSSQILKNHGIALEVKGPESQPKPHTRQIPC